MNSSLAEGKFMHAVAARLFPICRSLTGDGIRQTLSIFKEHLPELVIHEIPSGTRCFDWTVPDEWNIRDAFVLDPTGKKIIDFTKCNLHLLGYSEPVDKEVTLNELQAHLHSLPDLPDAIPYVSSFYNRAWGFCISHNERQKLREGTYRVFIDSTLEPGNLTYAELLLPGSDQQEVLISTYVCHPSLANNELSGPVVCLQLAKWLSELAQRRYSYRFLFIPETIGSIAYISRHLDHLQKYVIAGFTITCIGDERAYSYLPSRAGNTLSDQVAQHVLKHRAPDYIRYSFLDRGSDERQYCAPGVDLPIASLMRSKYGVYPEYHTSLDDLTLVTPKGLQGGYEVLRDCITAIEMDRRYQVTVLCEPQMGKRGLYSPLMTRGVERAVQMRMDILTYCDGTHSLLDIADLLGTPVAEIFTFVEELIKHALVRPVS
jgi:aminopeptidase-like protein